jgi:predicted RNase H-like nuclease (RuvC/YqgF family)
MEKLKKNRLNLCFMARVLVKNVKSMIILACLFLILIIFVIRPSFIGYSTYQQVKKTNLSVGDYGADIQELREKLLISNTNISACNNFNTKLLDEIGLFSDKYSECGSELSSIKSNLSFSTRRYEETLKRLNSDLDEKDDEIKKLKEDLEKEADDIREDFELLGKNTANNLCCKSKVDNPNIKYYTIENNKIICLEQGSLEISC